MMLLDCVLTIPYARSELDLRVVRVLAEGPCDLGLPGIANVLLAQIVAVVVS